MAAAVYLIQEGHWRGEDITFYALDLHGANDGAAASVAAEQYWNKNHPMENTKGYVARGGRMLNYRTYVDLMDLLDRIPSVTEPGMTAAEDTRDFDSKHRTFDKARLMQGGKGIIDGHKLGLNNLDRMLLTRLIRKKNWTMFRSLNTLKMIHICSKRISGTCGRRHLPFALNHQRKNYGAICTK